MLRDRALLFTGFFERDLAFYLETMQTNIALASLGPPRSLEMSQFVEKRDAKARKQFYVVSALLLPGLGNSVLREAGGLARLRLAQCAVAVERFRLSEGRLPAELKEVVPRFLPLVPVDPFNDTPMRYRLLAKGYVVYVVEHERPAGWRLTDNAFTVER